MMMMNIVMMPVMMIMIAAMPRGGRTAAAAFVGVFKMRRIDDAFWRMRTRLMIFEAVKVAKLFTTIGFFAFKILSRSGRFGTLARVEAKPFGETHVVVLSVRTPVQREGGQ